MLTFVSLDDFLTNATQYTDLIEVLFWVIITIGIIRVYRGADKQIDKVEGAQALVLILLFYAVFKDANREKEYHLFSDYFYAFFIAGLLLLAKLEKALEIIKDMRNGKKSAKNQGDASDE